MIYFDLETTVNGGPQGDSPEAHWDSNRVLMCGHATMLGSIHINPSTHYLANDIRDEIRDKGMCTLVAHNAKFDIKYLMRDHPNIPWHKVTVWDTMTWEYRASGHRKTMPSLEDVAFTYGIKQRKTLDLGALLKQGVKMEDIPQEELGDYLTGDVSILREIHRQQLYVGEEYNMDYLLPLAEMELNGLPMDTYGAEQKAYALTADIMAAQNYFIQYIMYNCEWQDGSAVTPDDFNDMVKPKTKCIKPTANRTISMLLTGCPSELNVTQKWKLSLKGQPILPQSVVDDIYEDIKPTHIGYPVDEETMDRIGLRLTDDEFCTKLIEYRKATKVVDTYLLPMLQQAKIQGTVHPKLNTAITSTGRLSSSAPNGQNMPPLVREMIVAKEGNVMEELDYSQLEMVAAATCSKCKALIKDMNDGVDIHRNTAAKVFGEDLAEEKRKIAKNVNFGVLYGGKAYGLSKQTGVDKDTVQQLIDAFFNSYRGVAHWQRTVYEEIVDNMRAYDVHSGHQRYCSDWVLPISDRKFRFIETEAPMWLRNKTGRAYSFSPNQTANYPIQGFAGGDIVMEGLTYLWRSIRGSMVSDHVQFRMTVHDSILLEKKATLDLAEFYDGMIDHVMSKYKLPVQLQVDVEAGPTWR